MDGFTIFVNFLLIVIFIALNGFFVSAEFTIVKVRLSQLEELIAKGDKRAEYAKQLADQMDVSLSVTQLGITLASLALGWIGEPFLAELLRAPLAAVGVTGAAVDTVAFAVAFSFITAAHITGMRMSVPRGRPYGKAEWQHGFSASAHERVC